MNWQPNYWILESISFEIEISPIIRFESHIQREKFNDYDFNLMLKYILQLRKKETTKISSVIIGFNDDIMSFLRIESQNADEYNMIPCSVKHASQEKVQLTISKNIINLIIKEKSTNSQLIFNNQIIQDKED